MAKVAVSFGVTDSVRACEVPLLSDYNGHSSFKRLISAGYQIVTF